MSEHRCAQLNGRYQRPSSSQPEGTCEQMNTMADTKRSRALYSREGALPPGVHAVPVDGAEELAPYGVALGRRVHLARRFRHATLPEGWRYVDSGRAVWSKIVDQFDRTRAGITWIVDDRGWRPCLVVYPARSYALWVVEDDVPLTVDDRWATREALLETVDERVAVFRRMVKTLEATLARCDEFRPIGNTGVEWDRYGRRRAEELADIRGRLEQWELARSRFETAPVMPHGGRSGAGERR